MIQDRHVVVTTRAAARARPPTTDVLGLPGSAVRAPGVLDRLGRRRPGAADRLRLRDLRRGLRRRAHHGDRQRRRLPALSWVNATALDLTVPAGKPGALTTIVLLDDSIAGPRISRPALRRGHHRQQRPGRLAVGLDHDGQGCGSQRRPTAGRC